MPSANPPQRQAAVVPEQRAKYYAGLAAFVSGAAVSCVNVLTWSFHHGMTALALLNVSLGAYLLISALSESAAARDRSRGGRSQEAWPDDSDPKTVTDAQAVPVRLGQAIRVRCGRCAALNEETARYCSMCGGSFPVAGGSPLQDP